VSYYHQLLGAVIVHPDRDQVLPLFPEAITHQDGATKNDCEANASKRLLKQLRASNSRSVYLSRFSIGQTMAFSAG